MKNLVLIFCLVVAHYSLKARSIIIDISEPSFRKLVVAIPQFKSKKAVVLPQEKSALYDEALKEGSSYLAKLLKFSGYFTYMKEDAYKGYKNEQSVSIETIEQDFWKKLKVDAVTLARLTPERKNILHLEIRTFDSLHGGKQIIGKRYTVSSSETFKKALRHYADHLLTAYTGKVGIFSSRFVFIGKKTASSHKQVYTCNIDGSELQQITFAPTTHLSPSWSADGQKILFTSYEHNNPDLFMIDLNSKQKFKISGYQGINSGGVFSYNNKFIAFSGSINGNTEIFLTHAKDFKHRVPFLSGHGIDVDPSFSPDGKKLAFVSGRYGNPHIFVASLRWDEEESRVSIQKDVPLKRLTYAGWYNANPAWSPDSKKIAFAGFDKEINRFDLFLMNADGTQLERLTLQKGNNESPSWSPNGQMLVFQSNRLGNSNQQGRSKLHLMNHDGSDQRVLELPLYEVQSPKWGPNLNGQNS